MKAFFPSKCRRLKPRFKYHILTYSFHIELYKYPLLNNGESIYKNSKSRLQRRFCRKTGNPLSTRTTVCSILYLWFTHNIALQPYFIVPIQHIVFLASGAIIFKICLSNNTINRNATSIVVSFNVFKNTVHT